MNIQTVLLTFFLFQLNKNVVFVFSNKQITIGDQCYFNSSSNIKGFCAAENDCKYPTSPKYNWLCNEEPSQICCPDSLNEDFDDELHFLIIGGERTIAREFPHMVALGWQIGNKKYEWKCGGSLISAKYVVTAAHCSYDGEAHPAVIGCDDDPKDDSIDFKKIVGISRIIKHPKYSHLSLYYDIALLLLNETIKFSPFVNPACISRDRENNKLSKILTATGWGLTGHLGNSSVSLLKVALTIVENDVCSQHFKVSRKLRHGIIDKQLCVGDQMNDEARDTCQGDSGGPLQFLDNETKCYTIVGITSFGIGCGFKKPSVYTRVLSYSDWIDSIIFNKSTTIIKGNGTEKSPILKFV